jgi:NTP pyrophosphatase (non-canonical NTP hydrolase)
MIQNIEKFNNYQQEARKLDIYPINKEGILAHALGLGNEAGEVLGKLKKCIRDLGSDFNNPIFKEDIKKELGDTLWYLANIAQDFGITLEEVASYNIYKLLDRKTRGTLQGSGGDR